MGRKKATQLKQETKQLLDQHLDAASAAPRPSSDLFFVDRSSAGAAAKQAGKRKRTDAHDTPTQVTKKAKQEAQATSAAGARAAAADDAMDTGTDAAFFHESDEEEVGHVVRDKVQRAAHTRESARKLVSAREAQRLERAAQVKAEKEAAAAAAQPKLFDLWATTLEEDLAKGIKPATDAKGFRVGRTVQSRFRHEGVDRSKAHVQPSVLPKQIHEGASFHPAPEAHQDLLRKAYEKDEAEREEQRRIQARFNVKLPEVNAAAAAAASASGATGAAAEDDSWMDEKEPVKGPTPSSKKYSKAERNRLARAAENRAAQEAQAKEKALGKIVQRIPVLVAEWKKEAKARAKAKARVEELKRLHPDRKPKLGKYAEAEAFPDVALTEELPEDGSLRALKPSAKVLEEQFARFQQRHLIETRKKVKKTRPTLKVRQVERFKDFEVPGAAAAGEPRD